MQKLHKPLSRCISGLADELVAKRHDDAMAQCDLLGRKKEKKNVSWKGVSSYRADLIKNSIPYQFKGQSWQHVSASRCTASAIPDHH